MSRRQRGACGLIDDEAVIVVAGFEKIGKIRATDS